MPGSPAAMGDPAHWTGVDLSGGGDRERWAWGANNGKPTHGMPAASVELRPGQAAPQPYGPPPPTAPDWGQINTPLYDAENRPSVAGQQGRAYDMSMPSYTPQGQATLNRMRGMSGQQGPAERGFAAQNAAEQRLQFMKEAADIQTDQANNIHPGPALQERAGAQPKQGPLYAHTPDGTIYNVQTGERASEGTPKAEKPVKAPDIVAAKFKLGERIQKWKEKVVSLKKELKPDAGLIKSHEDFIKEMEEMEKNMSGDAAGSSAPGTPPPAATVPPAWTPGSRNKKAAA